MAVEREYPGEETPHTSVEIVSPILGVEDPTEETFARRLATMAYLENFGQNDLDFNDAYRAMYEGDQEYFTQEIIGRIRLPHNGQLFTAGTLRLLRGKDAQYPIEAARYFSKPEGWGDPSKLCEIGRLAFVPTQDYRVDPKSDEAKRIRSKLLASMTIHAAQEGAKVGKTTLHAVMPGYIRGMYRNEGIQPRIAPGAELIGSDENTQLFDKFLKYWRNSKYPPRLCEWNIEELLDTSSPKEQSGIIFARPKYSPDTQ